MEVRNFTSCGCICGSKVNEVKIFVVDVYTWMWNTYTRICSFYRGWMRAIALHVHMLVSSYLSFPIIHTHSDSSRYSIISHCLVHVSLCSVDVSLCSVHVNRVLETTHHHHHISQSHATSTHHHQHLSHAQATRTATRTASTRTATRTIRH